MDSGEKSGPARARIGMPSLVAADMDGTFLATSKAIPAANLRLLDALARRGIPFVPCTGRPVIGIPAELLAHPATRYAIGSNGAVVYDVAAHTALHVEEMDKALVLRLFERVRDLQTSFDVFADGEVFAERWRYEAMGDFGIDEPSLAVLRRVRKPVDEDVPSIVDRVSHVEKITCFWRSEQDRDALQRAIDELGGFSSAHGHPKNFELQARGVSKGSGITWLCTHAGLDARKAVAFGDEANDLPLLAAVGDGVAMANATTEVLDAADHVTLTNDEAGVAHYLFSVLSGHSPS